MLKTLFIILTVAVLSLYGSAEFLKAQDSTTLSVSSSSLSDPMISRYLRFSRLTAETVLSGDHTRNVVQDQRGLMWFATLSGLNRFDGTSVKLYRNDPDDMQSLSNNVVRALVVDQNEVLWVGTWGGGLNRYDWENDTFTRYQNDPDNPRSLSDNIVRAVYEDRSGAIWVGTMGGLNRLDKDSDQFTRFQHNPDDPNSLSDNVIWSIFEDRAGVLWVGTENGLNYFKPDTDTFVSYRHDPEDPATISHNSVRSVFEDNSGNIWLGTGGGLDKLGPDRTKIASYKHDNQDVLSLSHNVIHWVHEDRAGRLWIGTWGGGLNLFDHETGGFTHFRHNTADPYSLSSDSIWQIYEGEQGMLWIATEGGISYFDSQAKPFHHYRALPGTPNSLSDSHVNALHAGRNGVVWVATNSGGLNKFDRRSETFTQYLNSASDPINLSSDNLTAVFEDRQGLVWIGTRGSGLFRYNPNTGDIIKYSHNAADPHSLSYNSIVNIREDSTGVLWIGTYGGGLNAFDRNTGLFTRYRHDPSNPRSLSNNVITCVYEDRAGDIWVCTISGGVNKLDRATGNFTRYVHDAKDPRSISNNGIVSVFEGQSGDFWIGTASGLDKFDRQSGHVVLRYSTKQGLPDDTINGILEDSQGQLWLGTQNGLSRFDPQKGIFRNFTASDGLQGKSFAIYTSPSKSADGEMFFPGSGGFNAFYPSQIADNLKPPPVLISNFQLANKTVPIGDDSVLKKSILETEELLLSYLDNVFSFEFVALDYRDPKKNRYRYKMEGFEQEWNAVDSSRRFATYTNLDPGTYIFRVLASNNDGIWNEEGASIRITITPPWWETFWFRVILAVSAMVVLVAGFRWRVKSIEVRSKELKIQVEERTKELHQAKEVAESANRTKSIFLANMSHELRTPLHAILGFTRVMTRDSDISNENQERLDIINRSGGHLLDMIDDILNLSQIEAGRIELRKEIFELPATVQEVAGMFKSTAGDKGLQFNLEIDPQTPPFLMGDSGKLRQILINLLGNAVKFTDEGNIWLRVALNQAGDDPEMVSLRFEVQDTGSGIPQDKGDEAFEAFVQISHEKNIKGGTGLGLAISKTMVEMMSGKISLLSELGQGTTVTFTIPCHVPGALEEPAPKESKPEVIGLQEGQQEWRILIVDDNLENRVLLNELLTRAGFEIKEAENGEKAVSLFQEWQPHFLWMDIRMPVMDGFAATRNIRSLPGGDEVKIAAVTASVLEERHKEIIACGCDEVVRKPFKDHEIYETMARYLDIRYIYQEQERTEIKPQEDALTPEMLSRVPAELLNELHEMTKVLNREAILDVISKIAELEAEVAADLRTLVDNFQMDELHELLQSERLKPTQ